MVEAFTASDCSVKRLCTPIYVRRLTAVNLASAILKTGEERPDACASCGLHHYKTLTADFQNRVQRSWPLYKPALPTTIKVDESL